MTKNSDKPKRKHPFYIGQPHDDVRLVCKRTGRTRLKLEVLDGMTFKPMRAIDEVDLKADLTFRAIYTDVVLVFQRTDGTDRRGRCYRIIGIGEKGKDEQLYPPNASVERKAQ